MCKYANIRNFTQVLGENYHMSPLTGTHITYLYMYKYMNVHTYTRMCLSARACIDKMLIQQTAGNQRVTKILKSHEMSWKIQQLDSSGLTEALSQSKTNKFIYGICLRMYIEMQVPM